ncbi:MAG: hypothetical protein BWY57_02626 [Betaproteobacteria bacterium ADurb.Bin341]|nr:MAG: hypothetical protein BWY57_02626 [Betaproteobacteria bacterium ADurb.Bin341]
MLLLFEETPVRPQLEPADQRRQRQPLADQRDGDDEEGQENDQVARRKRLSVRQGNRQGQRGGERNNAAHAAPADQRQFAPARFGRLLMQSAA